MDPAVADGPAVPHSHCGQNVTTYGKQLPDGGGVTQGWSNQTLDSSGTCAGAPRGCDPQSV